MLAIRNIHSSFHYFITISYNMIKLNIISIYFISKIVYPANYILILAIFQKLIDFHICLFFFCQLYAFCNANINAINVD